MLYRAVHNVHFDVFACASVAAAHTNSNNYYHCQYVNKRQCSRNECNLYNTCHMFCAFKPFSQSIIIHFNELITSFTAWTECTIEYWYPFAVVRLRNRMENGERQRNMITTPYRTRAISIVMGINRCSKLNSKWKINVRSRNIWLSHLILHSFAHLYKIYGI